MQQPNLRYANDFGLVAGYGRAMSKTRPKRFTNWYLRQWMATLGVTQVELIEATGMNKTTMSLLCNSQQDYSPEIIRDVATALKIAPYELLLHPEDAMSIRSLITKADEVSDLGRRLHVVSGASVA